MPFAFGPREGLDYPKRCVTQCLDVSALSQNSRALDLGCSVGRSSFELARFVGQVIGIDLSESFIGAASTLQREGRLRYRRLDEGRISTELEAVVDPAIDRSRVHFEVGDACNLRAGLGSFDVILLANLIDRVPDPIRCLRRVIELTSPGAQVIITSPYTWLEEFTPESHWLGGISIAERSHRTLEGLRSVLGNQLALVAVKELPFLIREHERKYQWSSAQGTIWRKF